MRAEPTVPASALAAISEPFRGSGAVFIDPSVIQPLNLFLDLAGETMRSHLLLALDDSGREACLRPDITVAVVRELAAAGVPAGRYWYDGKAFRRGLTANHADEFRQLGLETFGGPDSGYDDAEVPALAWTAALAGGRKDLAMHVSDIGVFAALLQDIGVPNPMAQRLSRLLPQEAEFESAIERALAPRIHQPNDVEEKVLKARDLSEGIAILEEEWARSGLEAVGGRQASEIVTRLWKRTQEESAARLSSEQARLIRTYAAIEGQWDGAMTRIQALAAGPLVAAKLRWRGQLLESLVERNVPAGRLFFSARVASPFSYYDDFLFDITSEALGRDRPVASGGRYDSLVARLGGPSGLAARGCTIRPWRAFSGGAQ